MSQTTPHKQIDGEPLVRQYLVSKTQRDKERVLNAYSPLVKYIIGRMNLPLNSVLNREDTYQFGVLGLMDALDRYDPEFNVSFKTFAYKRIHGAVVDAVRSNSLLSRDQMKTMRILLDCTARLQQELGRDPSPYEICSETGITEDNYFHLLQLSQMNFVIPLEDVKKDDEGESTLVRETIEDPEQKSPQMIFDEKILKRDLKQIVQELPERQRLVLALYFYEELTLFDIGQVLQISESRVSQIMNQTLVLIRKHLNQEKQTANAV